MSGKVGMSHIVMLQDGRETACDGLERSEDI